MSGLSEREPCPANSGLPGVGRWPTGTHLSENQSMPGCRQRQGKWACRDAIAAKSPTMRLLVQIKLPSAPSPRMTMESSSSIIFVPATMSSGAEKESDGFSTNWSGWRGQVELQRATVAAGGACQEVTLNMGARGAIMRVRATDRATHEALLNIQVNFRNAED